LSLFLPGWLRLVPIHVLPFCPHFKMMNLRFICCNNLV
jgi:hypothetical protein